MQEVKRSPIGIWDDLCEAQGWGPEMQAAMLESFILHRNLFQAFLSWAQKFAQEKTE